MKQNLLTRNKIYWQILNSHSVRNTETTNFPLSKKLKPQDSTPFIQWDNKYVFNKKSDTAKVMDFWKHKEIHAFWNYGNLQEVNCVLAIPFLGLSMEKIWNGDTLKFSLEFPLRLSS